MSDQVGNQNVCFLMTRLICSLCLDSGIVLVCETLVNFNEYTGWLVTDLVHIPEFMFSFVETHIRINLDDCPQASQSGKNIVTK